MDFKYGDLCIKCHKCGKIQVVEELVTEGRAIYLFNKEDSYIKLNCPDCDITMEMCILPNETANAEFNDTNLEENNEELPQEVVTEEAV